MEYLTFDISTPHRLVNSYLVDTLLKISIHLPKNTADYCIFASNIKYSF